MLSNIKGIYMKNKKPIFLIIVFLFISLVVFSAFKFLNSKKDNPSLSKAVVFRKDLSLTTQATGIVKPMIGAEVKVGSRISGKVEHLYANVGEEVKKGDAFGLKVDQAVKVGTEVLTACGRMFEERLQGGRMRRLGYQLALTMAMGMP